MSSGDTDVALDPGSVEWSGVMSARYFVTQTFRYEYEEPIRNLQHRLIVAPRQRHLDQARVDHRVWTSAPHAPTLGTDEFGNEVASVCAPHVEREISFGLESTIVRDRRSSAASPPADAADPRWLQSGRLTRADEPLCDAADELRARNRALDERIDAIVRFVSRHMTYTKGVTDVFTTASTAFSMRRGVCQDYAHIALALARRAGIPARYASGHLIGEGATHAWVEFLIARNGGTTVISFDPTYGSATDYRYLVVAIGRDYDDVPPTSGSFAGRSRGRLQGRQNVRLTHVAYA